MSTTSGQRERQVLASRFHIHTVLTCHLPSQKNRGVWSRLIASLQTDPDLSAGLRDSTVVSAASPPPQSRDGSRPRRSRGGFGTQIHVLADRRGRPLRVTGGPRHDSTQARALEEAWTEGGPA